MITYHRKSCTRKKWQTKLDLTMKVTWAGITVPAQIQQLLFTILNMKVIDIEGIIMGCLRVLKQLENLCLFEVTRKYPSTSFHIQILITVAYCSWKIILLWPRYRLWNVSNNAVVESTITCFYQQDDGSCEGVNIPECEDRTVRYSIIPNLIIVHSQPDSPGEMTGLGNARNPPDRQQLVNQSYLIITIVNSISCKYSMVSVISTLVVINTVFSYCDIILYS